MWNALRNDLTEFVSAVKEDTTSALNQMDEDFDKEELTPVEEEAIRRSNLPETYLAPLTSPDTDEAEATRVADFLEGFSLDAQKDDMTRLLEENPDTIKKFLDELVPDQVSEEEFWQRYYYRCDLDQIAGEYEDNEPGAINSLGNLLGGAVKAVSASLAEDDNGDKMTPGGGAKTTASALFQGARPPFVMNTAVSEDDDEEEEEELGWDDDDDDDDEEDDDDDEDDTEEQIVFKDEATERLQDELKQAIEERDLLQQTVHMQAKEIAAIKKTTEVHSKDEVDELKMKLFEMNSELAAVKASQLDTSRVDSAEGSDPALVETKKSLMEAQGKIDEMSALLESNKTMIDAFQSEKARLEAKVSGLESSKGTPSEMEAKVAELGAALQSLTMEKTELEKILETTRAASKSSLAQLQEELAAAKAESAKAQSALEASMSEVDAANRRAESLEQELGEVKTQLRAKEEQVAKLEEDSAARLSASPDTVSTGVRVESPAVTKTPVSKGEGDDEEDDWGDDWGDESESAP